MTNNVIKCKTIANLGSFSILLPFLRTSWGGGVLNSAIFNSFHSKVEFGTILEGLWNFGWGGGLNPPPRYTNGQRFRKQDYFAVYFTMASCQDYIALMTDE